RVDDPWVGRLISGPDTSAALEAGFLVDGKIVARASSDLAAPQPTAAFVEALAKACAAPAINETCSIKIHVDGERFLGEASAFAPALHRRGAVFVVCSLDAALAELRRLQHII